MITKSSTEVGLTPTSKPECRSMTGYAMVRGDFEQSVVRVSVKSVNHRFLEVKIRVNECLEAYEQRLRQAVRRRILRGYVEVHVSIEPSDNATVHVNRELLKAYVNAAEELRKQMGAKAELDTVALLRLPGVITGMASVFPETEEAQEELGRVVETYVEDALGKMDEMRRIEGRHFTEELRARVAKIGEEAEQVRALVRTLRPAISRRFEARLREMLNGSHIESTRLAQEAAILAERSDVSEELDRLQSHLQQFTKLLDSSGEVGKKLDFLLQEMHRETNTMLSKTPGVETEALAIESLALEIKMDIEKLRESVQDIE